MRAIVLVLSLLLWVGCQKADEPTEPVVKEVDEERLESHPRLDERSASGLEYDVVGEGPLVVLVHGTNLDRRLWKGDVEWLKAEARVLSYDLRGHGGSAFPEEPYSNEADLIELLAELGDGKAVLVGLSAGAQVALDVALEMPELVDRLVLVSPSLFGYQVEEAPPFFTELGKALQEQDYEAANEVLLASPIMAVPESQAALMRTMVEENERLWTIPHTLVERPEIPALERLEEVAVPTLVLVGENDLAAVQAQGELLEERLPDAQLVVVEGGGHLLNLTSPEIFRAEVGGFLGMSGD